MNHSILTHRIRLLRACAILMAAVTALAAHAGEVTATRTYDISSVTLGSVTAPDGTVFQTISLPGTYNRGEIGSPELPVEYVRFIVPVYSNNFRATVSEVSDVRRIGISGCVYPVQPPQKTDGSPAPDFVYPDEEAYSVATSMSAWVVGDGYIDGCNHIVTVAVRPVTYSNLRKTAVVAGSLTVSLSYDECTADALTGSRPVFPPRASRHLDLSASVVNEPDIVAFAPQYSPARIVSDIDKTPDHYYIIVPETLEEAVEDLAIWKRQKGYNVVVKTIESICASYTVGSVNSYISGDSSVTEELVDSAASLRAYLRDEFIENGAFFCLIIGDDKTSMPIRRVRGALYEHKNPYSYSYDFNPCGEFYTPTDAYFSDLTTRWDLTQRDREVIYSADKNGTSYNPDIYNGRLLCNRPYEVGNYIRKLIIYEADPGKGDPSYLNSAMFFTQGHIDGQSGYQLLKDADIVREVFDPFPESTIVLADSCYYDNVSNLLPHQGCDVIKAIGKVGFSSWHGHGSPAVVSCCNWQYFITPIRDYTDDQMNKKRQWWDADNGVDQLGNTGRPSIAYTVACAPTPFDTYVLPHVIKNGNELLDRVDGHSYDIPYNFGSSFTVAGDFGGPAFLGSTRWAWRYDAPRLERIFGSLLYKNSKVGVAETLCKIGYPDSHTIFTHHLIGEPEFEMWLDIPEKFSDLDFGGAGLSVSGGDLPGSILSVYTGDGRSFRWECNSNSYNLSSNLVRSDFAISVWKNGYIPEIKMFTLPGRVAKKSKRYIVKDAVIGQSLTSPSSYSSQYVIGSEGKISVAAYNSITLHNGLIIEDGGEVILECDKEVVLNGTVKSGGKLTVKAAKVRIAPGFKAETGAIVKIN